MESKCAGKILMLHALLYRVRRDLMITMVTMSELDLLMESPLDHSAPVKTSLRLLYQARRLTNGRPVFGRVSQSQINAGRLLKVSISQ